MTGYFSKPDHPKMYRAVGLLQGKYLPSAENATKGFFLASDGTQFPAIISGHTASRLQNHPEWIHEDFCWSAWPRMRKEPPQLFFRLISVKSGKDEAEQTLIEANVDLFSIRGVVAKYDSTGKLTIRIRRNEKAPEGKERLFSWRPFYLDIEGFLPSGELGQFWELQCRRDRDRLVLEDAHLVQGASLPQKKDTSVPTHDASASPKGKLRKAQLAAHD